MQGWDRNKWDMYDSQIDIGFHGPDIFLTPLINWVSFPPGADNWYTGNELLGGHVNQNAIGNRQRYIDAMYVDMRRRKLTSEGRYAGKVQVHEFDQINSRFSGGSPSWILAILRERLMQSILMTHEKLARDMIFDYCLFKFLADGTKWNATTANFSDLAASTSYQLRLKFINEVKLRLIERSRQWTQRAGSWGAPIPNYPGDTMIMTTPNVMFDLWESDEGDWMQDLRQLQDDRIINGGSARYKGATFVDNYWLTLFNAGEIGMQVGVTSPINWGDGAPDPDSEAVDSVLYTGQSSENIVHYVQCSAFTADEFTAGDRVSIHVQRTTDWGITDGNDFLDGETYTNVIYEVQAATNRLVFMEPFVKDYVQSFTGTPNGGTEATLYAYITRARHIHPILVVAARGMATFAAKTKPRIHTPPDVADLPGVSRVTWDEYGGKNRWNPYIYEIIFCVASDTRSGRDEVDLR